MEESLRLGVQGIMKQLLPTFTVVFQCLCAMPWSLTDEISIAPYLAQDPWLKKGPKECLQDEKDVGYEICFGLWLPPLFTEPAEACSFVFSLVD